MSFLAKLIYHPKCLVGIHVPVRLEKKNGSHEYFCQNCCKDMTEREWLSYFTNKEKYEGREIAISPPKRVPPPPPKLKRSNVRNK